MSDAGILPTIKTQAARAFDYRLLLCWLLATLLPTLLVASPLGAIFSKVLDYSVDSAALAQRLNLDAVSALLGSYLENTGTVQANLTLGWICVLLSAPLLTAMAAAIFAAPVKLPLRRLLAVAVFDYGRWFWLHLCAFLLYLLGFGFALVVGFSAELRVEEYVDANSFSQMRTFSWLLALLMALMTHFFIEIARAEMLLDTHLRFPPSAFIRALERGKILRRVVGYLVVCLLGAAVLLLLLMLRQSMSGSGWISSVSTVVLTQCSVIALAWLRTTRLFVLAALGDPNVASKLSHSRP